MYEDSSIFTRTYFSFQICKIYKIRVEVTEGQKAEHLVRGTIPVLEVTTQRLTAQNFW